jgi:hypothetical protein
MTVDGGKLIEWFVTVVVGAAIVKLMDLLVERYRRSLQRSEEKVNKVVGYLNEFGELANLYRFFCHSESHLARGEDGELVKDGAGRFVVREDSLEPEPRFERAIEALRDANVDSVIAQKIVRIRLMSGEVFDIVQELDPTGNLKKRLGELYQQTIAAVEYWKKDGNLKQMAIALKEADQERGEIRSML